MTFKVEKPSGMSSEAVRNGTGKTWEEWVELLDADNAATLNHTQIAALIVEKYGISGWWGRGVAVGYEQAKGLRVVGQGSDGYAASASKTVNVPVERLWAAFARDDQRRQWLGEAPVEVTTATEPKSVRMKWLMDDSRVSIDFYSKGENKSNVNLQQSRLADLEGVAEAKAFWKQALERMKSQVESSATK